MKVAFRQGIVRHQTDISGTQTFLQVSGSAVSLNVSPDPTIITFAHDDTNYSFVERVSVSNAWTGPFSSGTDYWLYWDINLVTGVRTFGHTLLEPVVSSVAPVSPVSDKHWFDSVTKTMKVWNGVKWIPKIRVFAAKYLSGTSFVKMSGVGGSTFTGSQAGLNTTVNSGSLVFDVTGAPIMRGDGKFFTTEDTFVSGVPSGTTVKLESILIPAESQQNLSAYTVVKFSAFNEIVAADAATADSLPFGIIEEDATVGDIVNVTMEGLVTNPDWDWEEVNSQVFCDEDGVVVDTALSSSQLPIGVVVDKTTILLRAPQLLLESAATDIPDASTTIKGATKLSVAPALSTNPIAVGDNDPRVQNVAHSGANTDITSVLLNQTGLVVKGATSVGLTIRPNETLTTGRTLNIITGDADRSLTLTGDASIAGTHSGTSSGTNTGDQTITLTGDVTGTGTGSFAASIANQAVTFAKFQNIATSRLLGRTSASSGSVEELTVGSGLVLSGGTLTVANPGYEHFTATPSQTVFTLTNFTYTPGSHRLMVFVDGVKQVLPPNGGYTETDSSTFTFTVGLTGGESVEAYLI